jgi:alpha-tubulin suppressor-like RCC1 family protein
MARRQGGTLGTFTPLSTPNAPTDLSVSTSIGSASVSFTAPTDTGDGAVTSYIVTAIDESTGASTGATGSASPITVSPGGGTFKIRAQAVNGFGPGRLTEFSTGNAIFSGVEIYGSGENDDGRLGDGTGIDRSSPVQVGALTSWSKVVSGGSHTLAIKTSGTLWAWGSNGRGRLGDGTTISRSSPVQVGALTTWFQLAAGAEHTAVIKTDGTLWTWGSNENGQLGISGNGGAHRSSPVQVGSLTNWAQVAAGSNECAAIKTDGTLWSWGNNGNGALGIGTSYPDSRSSPVQIGALTNWAQVSVDQGGLALTTGGELYAWGRNSTGKVGDGTAADKSSPVQIGALTNWSQVSTNTGHSAALKTDGTLWVWGGGSTGRLGDGTVVDKSSPIQVGALTNWLQVSAGNYFTASVKTDGTLWTWGFNTDGRLGDGTGVSASSPIQIGALTTWLQVSGGSGNFSATLGVV